MSLEVTKEMSYADKLAMVDKISAQVNEKAGKKIAGRIGADPEIMDKLTIKFIASKSKDFNRATGGGYPRSRCTIIAGAEDSGKTSRVLEDIGYQMSINPNFWAIWIESEKSLEKGFVCETFKIDPERFVFIEYDDTKGAEGILDILYGFMKQVPFDLVCINSLKCLTPKKILDSDMDFSQPGVAARLNSLMVSKFTALVSNQSTAFIIITHQYTAIGGYGSPQVITGGNAIKYWAALTLGFSKSSIKEDDPIGKEDGVHINVSVKKNHCVPNRNPYVKFDYYVIFNEGTEQILSSVPELVDAGILSVSAGNYKVFNDKGEEEWKIRGKNNFRDYMKEHPDFFESLCARLNSGGSKVQTMTEEEVAAAEKEQEEEAKAAAEVSDKKTKGKKSK